MRATLCDMKVDRSSLAEIQRAIVSSWCLETSGQPEQWIDDDAARGQCAVTALVLQDFFGGELLRAEVGDVSHYWNELPDGDEIDLTRHQFEVFVPVGIEKRDRTYVLSYPDTRSRYARLSTLVQERLEAQREQSAMASPIHVKHP